MTNNPWASREYLKELSLRSLQEYKALMYGEFSAYDLSTFPIVILANYYTYRDYLMIHDLKRNDIWYHASDLKSIRQSISRTSRIIILGSPPLDAVEYAWILNDQGRAIVEYGHVY